LPGGNEPRAIAGRYSARAGAPRWFAEWRTRLPDNRYSRRVAMLKLALPAIGVSLLLMVMAWPRIAPLFDRLRFAAIDPREASELRMINPRYAGTDRDGRPFVITAAVGRQVPQRDDVMSLDQPVANLQSHSGAKIVVTSDSGVYQTQTQYLDMFGNVTIKHEDGTTFVTSAARMDAAHNAAEGSVPVEGHGPRGTITAQGFRVLDNGNITIFTGKSNMVLKSTAQQTTAPAPAAVPAPIAQAAAQIEAKMEAKPIAPAAHPAAAAKATPPPHHEAKAPAHPAPAPKKPG
jgi:lipopolysaccharide export system protein LptC